MPQLDKQFSGMLTHLYLFRPSKTSDLWLSQLFIHQVFEAGIELVNQARELLDEQLVIKLGVY